MNAITIQDALNRRTFLQRAGLGVGAAALGSLLNPEFLSAAITDAVAKKNGGLPGLPHFAPKAKRIIYLFQNGAPSQIDLFDPKPFLDKVHGTDLPESVRQGQRLTTMTSGQKSFPVARSLFKFQQYGQSGTWFSELIPHTAKIADELCVIRSMHTEAINHDPAVTFIQTGSQQAGRPCMGAWMAYGLGSENRDLPAFVVMTSRGSGRKNDQPLYDRLWSAGFLPSRYQGVRFRAGADPVLYLSNPPGFDAGARRDLLDDLARMNQLKLDAYGDPEISTRIAQYEMAFRMQTSVPDLTDLSKEPASTFELYGPDSRKPGTFAYNCLLARRLAERDVRFIQLYHMGWDQHENLPAQIRAQCADTDQPSAALVQDLKARGMLDDTLIIWGGEFGRTVYCQGKLTADNYGRDHHPRCFSIWLAGGGVKKGLTHGETDDFSYNIIRDAVHVHDLNATVQHLMGIDHTRLTYKYQGRHFRLTDVHGEVVKPLVG
jgi:Protein of unknown function (DUF1501)